MRTDIIDFHDFYRSPLGDMAARHISERLLEAWDDTRQLRIAGFGYANPFLDLFADAERRIALAPAGQGVIRWPPRSENCATLVAENAWPLPDASVDRLLIVHGLEEAPDPRRLMREAWRVLADDGRLIIVASHRRGLWSIVETTPFAAGRPYLKGQLNRLLSDALFGEASWNAGLFFPPVKSRFILRSARAWERAGLRVWPGLAGVLMVEAGKDLMAPAGLVRRKRDLARKPALATPRPAGAGRNSIKRAPPRKGG